MATGITVYTLTFNEAWQIRPMLDSVKWAAEMIVVDSLSTDGTAKVCAEHGVRHVNLRFEGVGRLRNQTVALVSHDWVMSMDTDKCRAPSAQFIERWLSTQRKHDRPCKRLVDQTSPR